MRIALKTLALAALTTIVGCASSSGVVPIGPDTYMISRQAGSGFTGLGSLKADSFREAAKFCVDQKRSIRVVNTSDSSPPYIMGNFPRTEVQFMCLEAQDTEMTRPKLQPVPTAVIEVKGR